MMKRNQIRFKTNFSNCVLTALRNRKWKETDSELEWDIIWAERDWMREVFDHVHLAPKQKVNHFRNHYEVREAAYPGYEERLHD